MKTLPYILINACEKNVVNRFSRPGRKSKLELKIENIFNKHEF